MQLANVQICLYPGALTSPKNTVIASFHLQCVALNNIVKKKTSSTAFHSELAAFAEDSSQSIATIVSEYVDIFEFLPCPWFKAIITDIYFLYFLTVLYVKLVFFRCFPPSDLLHCAYSWCTNPVKCVCPCMRTLASRRLKDSNASKGEHFYSSSLESTVWRLPGGTECLLGTF